MCKHKRVVQLTALAIRLAVQLTEQCSEDLPTVSVMKHGGTIVETVIVVMPIPLVTKHSETTMATLCEAISIPSATKPGETTREIRFAEQPTLLETRPTETVKATSHVAIRIPLGIRRVGENVNPSVIVEK